MSRKIIFATGNEEKLNEIKMILEDMQIDGEPVEIYSMKEAGIQADICEDGTTFRENALIKVKAVAKKAPDAIVLADDSGLVIDALNGEPGIYSARYMGEKTSYHIKNRNLIERLKDVPWEQRTGRFVCAVAAALPDGQLLTWEGIMEGLIDYEEKGENGFGYDPIFFLPEYQMTSGQLTEEQKNAISHRGKALQLMKTELNRIFCNLNK